MGVENRGEYAGVVAILFLGLSWTAVMLRVYVRAFMTKAFGTDDYLVVLSLALFTFYCAFVLDGVHYGTGRHLKDIMKEPHGDRNFVIGMKAWWIAELGYVACTTILKISIGFFLLRVCIKKVQKYIIWTVLAVATAYSCCFFVLIIFQCRPLHYFWTRFDFSKTAKGACLSDEFIAVATYTHSAVSAAADWILGVLPISLVWDLNMTRPSKISVSIILGIGALGSAATIVRIPYIYQLTETMDFLYANVDVSIWSTVEPGIGITASSIACLRPLFKTFFSRTRVDPRSSTSGSIGWAPTPYSNGSRKGSSRTGSQNNDADSAERGFGPHVPAGSGVQTTIQSMNDVKRCEEREKSLNRLQKQRDKETTTQGTFEALHRMRRFGSGKDVTTSGQIRTWNSSDSGLQFQLSDKRRSDEQELIGGQSPPTSPGPMGILKTTDVEVRWSNDTIGLAVSSDNEKYV